MGQDSNSIIPISFLEYLIISLPCIIIYVLLALSNGRYILASFKAMTASAFLFLDVEAEFDIDANAEGIIFFLILIIVYFFLAFVDMYDYKVKLKSIYVNGD